MKIIVASLDGSWICARVNVQVPFVFIWTSEFIYMLWIITTFIEWVLALRLRYIYSQWVEGQRVLKLCLVDRHWVFPTLSIALGVLCGQLIYLWEHWTAASTAEHVSKLGSCRRISACLPEQSCTWLWGRSVLREAGADESGPGTHPRAPPCW